MAGERYYLTEADRNFLNALHRMFGHMLTPASTSKANLPEFPGQSQDVYIALVAETIPAATNNAGDDIPARVEGDKPGSAMCDIYHIINGELKLMGLQKRVHNLGDDDIESGWISVKKTKSGDWLADTGGGAACEGRNEQWILYLQGPPDDGSLSFPLIINGANFTITIPYNSTASEVETLLEAHPQVASGDVIVSGGPLPTASIIIEWTNNLADGLIPVPSVSIIGLIGSGLGATLIRTERGFPNDFS